MCLPACQGPSQFGTSFATALLLLCRISRAYYYARLEGILLCEVHSRLLYIYYAIHRGILLCIISAAYYRLHTIMPYVDYYAYYRGTTIEDTEEHLR